MYEPPEPGVDDLLGSYDWDEPSFQRMFGMCREAGALVFLHTDGHILEIIPDLVEAGVSLLNSQFRASRLAGLVKTTRGRVAIELDLDRQMFPFATPDEIEAHIIEAYSALHLAESALYPIGVTS